jgi:hypothetical protein
MTIILTGWTRDDTWWETLYVDGEVQAVGNGKTLTEAHADLLINKVLED